MTQTEEQTYRESHVRSIIKAFSWRFVSTCTTFAIVYLLTGELTLATSIAGVEVVIKMILYYFHERAWQRLPRGSIRELVKRKDT
ncbi:MAG: DUF2061 domain-containing protein [Kangiellaceae bacterium]|nr:DUF2061 domain-containing protein [Kangiellaceae bacterium]